MIVKVRYRCDACPAEITAEDTAPEPANGMRGTNRVLFTAGWLVLVDGARIGHFCPECKEQARF